MKTLDLIIIIATIVIVSIYFLHIKKKRLDSLYYYELADDRIASIALIASFTATPLNGDAPLIVQFTDTSLGSPTLWSWNFGDGNISTLQNPIHTYNNPGIYSITLKCRTGNCYDEITNVAYIDVDLPAPVAAFDSDICGGSPPIQVQFTDLSIGSQISRLWDFGDGNISTLQNPSHTYTSEGNYIVTLTVTNVSGSSTATIGQSCAEIEVLTIIPSVVSLPSDANRLIVPIIGSPSLHFSGSNTPFNQFGISTNTESQDPWVYVHSGFTLARINVNTQVFQIIGNTALELFDIGFGDDGILYGLQSYGDALWRVNINTAALTLVANSATLGMSAAFNSLCGGPNHTLYGLSSGTLRVTNLDTLSTTIVRSDVVNTGGDCVFFRGEFWWAAVDDRLYKITGPVATGPVINVGPTVGALYGLAVVNSVLWGFAGLNVYQINPTNGSVSSSFTVPNFGFNFIQGAAKRDEAIQSGTFLVTVELLDSVPITVSSDQTVTVNFTDPNFTRQVVILAGGSFVINSSYNAVNFIRSWLNN